MSLDRHYNINDSQERMQLYHVAAPPKALLLTEFHGEAAAPSKDFHKLEITDKGCVYTVWPISTACFRHQSSGVNGPWTYVCTLKEFVDEHPFKESILSVFGDETLENAVHRVKVALGLELEHAHHATPGSTDDSAPAPVVAH